MSGKLSRTVLRRGKGSNPFSLVDYASHTYQSLLQRNGIICSMSRKGDCWDNAVMESFFHTLKVELVYCTTFITRFQARRSIFEYIEVFYNRTRLHSAIGYNSPEEYEKARKVA